MMRLSLTTDSDWLAPRIAARPHPADQPGSLPGVFREDEPPGRSHLGAGFTLRCFQRLSLPRDSYPAVARAGQPVRQRRVQLGPLVLESSHPQISCAHGR